MPRSAFRVVLTGVVLCALVVPVSLPLAAQDGPGSTFSETVDVRVVNVDLYVTDRRGKPIPNLQQKDFELFEDDKKVKITNFYEGLASESRERISLIVYIDDTHLTSGNRNNVLESLLPFVERRVSEADTQVLVLRFDGLMHVEQSFTGDVEKVRAAFETLEQAEPKISQSAALERNMRSDMQQTMSMLTGGGGDERLARTSLDGLLSAVRGYGEAARADTGLSVDALGQVVASLGARPGRKSLYFVGDGLAMRPLGELVTSLQRQISRSSSAQGVGTGGDASQGLRMRTGSTLGSEDGPGVDDVVGTQQNDTSLARLEQTLQPLSSRPQILELGAIANASRVTIYPILPPVVDASTAGLGNRASENERPLSNMREALELMAASTGGQSMVAGQDVSAFLVRTDEAGAARYSLGFVPEEGTSGFHELRVKAKRGMRLRYRESYVAKSPMDLLADRAVGALTLGWVDNQHEVELELDSQTPSGDGNFDVTVLMAFPIRQLSLAEEGGIHSANCRVAVVVLNSLGQLSSPQFMEIPLQISADQLEDALAQHFGARLNLRLPAGQQQVAIGLWDENGQRGSFVTHAFTVGDS